MKNRKFKNILVTMTVAALAAGTMVGCGSSDSNKSVEGWDSSNDITIVSREDGSGTRGAFVELFGIEEEQDGEKVDMTTPDANITNSTSVMMTTVAGDEYAIGYVSLGSLNDSVKAVKIDGAEASEEAIKDGSYKISRPFNIVTTGDISAETQDFINFILSAQGQQVVSDNSYIPLDETTEYTASGMSGKITIAGSSSVSPVMEKLKEAYVKLNPDMNIEIHSSDSTTGVTSAIDGVCDIGMASRELKDSEVEKGAVNTVIATDGIAVIVNTESTVDELTSDQVKAIYKGEALTWDEVVE